MASTLLALIIGSAFAVLLLSILDLRRADEAVLRSEEVLAAANSFERLVIDAETGTRGYVITGREEFLAPWQAAQDSFGEQAGTLQRLVADTPEQRERAQRITQAARSYVYDYTVPLVDTARRDPEAARTVTVTREGKQRLDEIRTEFDRLIAAEQSLAAERQKDSEGDADRAIVAAAAGVLGSLLLVGLFAEYLRRAIVRPVRSAATMARRLAAGDLGARLPERGTGEIGVLERSFNTMAASLQESRDELAASRARIVAAGDQARRRIERDLHDGIQQRLVSLVLDLRSAEANIPPDLVEPRRQLADLADELTAATDGLRELSRGIHPAILSEGGVAPALKTLARRSAVPVDLTVDVDGRLPEQVEVAVYYVVSEALTNIAKHAEASLAVVAVEARGDTVRLTVRDDGRGGAQPGRGSGLVGLSDRVQALGGSLRVTSPAGGGTELLVELPIRDR